MKNLTFLIVLVLIVAGLACSENTENLITGSDGGDDNNDNEPIENVSYSNQVQPIFNTTCGGSNCHVGGSTNGVNLTSYSQTINSIGSRYGKEVVKPGDADDSPLVDKIEPNPQHGSKMPLGGSLTSDQIETIKVWINEGATNN